MNKEEQDDPQEPVADKPEIIVDEDWKSQVEREKEELKRGEETASSAPAADTSESTADESPAVEQLPEPPIPPASFTTLLSTLATQAMVGLGVFPDPMTGKPTVNRPLAKHFIDLIGMLDEKTQGNLSPEEAQQLSDSLHHLRMAFVATGDSGGAEAGDKAEVPQPPTKTSTIELP